MCPRMSNTQMPFGQKGLRALLNVFRCIKANTINVSLNSTDRDEERVQDSLALQCNQYQFNPSAMYGLNTANVVPEHSQE